MPRLLLDGTFLIDFRKEVDRDKPGPLTRFARALRVDALISVVSLAEFLEGRADIKEAIQWLARFGAPLEITRPVAIVAATLQRRLDASGKRLGENDSWQAALCLHHDLQIVSRDHRFSHVPRLSALSHGRTERR